MLFTIDGVDFSDVVDVAGYTIRPRREYGPARGQLLDGSKVVDLLATKTDLSIAVVATEQSVTSSISQICKKPSVRLVFNDPITNQNLNGKYEPNISEIQMAIEKTDSTPGYWYGFTIDFEEV